MSRYLLKADHAVVPLERQTIGQIDALLGGCGLDTVNLREKIECYGRNGEPILIEAGSVMLVNDTSMIDGLPVNELATALYRTRAPDSPYAIHGDVVIVPDKDFAP